MSEVTIGLKDIAKVSAQLEDNIIVGDNQEITSINRW